jgi:hypothetical protein
VPTATRLTIYDPRLTTHDRPSSERSERTILDPPSILFCLRDDLPPVGSKSLPWRGHVLDSDPGRDGVGRGTMISTVAAVFSDGFSRFDRPKKGVKMPDHEGPQKPHTAASGSRRDGGAPRSVNRRHRTPDSGRDGSGAVNDETLKRWSIPRPDRPSPVHTSSPARWRCIPPGSGWR